MSILYGQNDQDKKNSGPLMGNHIFDYSKYSSDEKKVDHN